MRIVGKFHDQSKSKLISIQRNIIFDCYPFLAQMRHPSACLLGIKSPVEERNFRNSWCFYQISTSILNRIRRHSSPWLCRAFRQSLLPKNVQLNPETPCKSRENFSVFTNKLPSQMFNKIYSLSSKNLRKLFLNFSTLKSIAGERPSRRVLSPFKTLKTL